MAEPYKHIYKVELNQQLVRRDVGLLATFDSKANRFGAQLYRDGAEVPASGYTVTGYFIRPDEETVNCPGTVEGNLVYVDLLPGCYIYDGAFEFTLKIKQGDEEKAVLMCYGNVVRSRTDATASGGGVVVTVTNAEKLGGKTPDHYKTVDDVLSYEEIAASTDLSGKIPEAKAIKDLASLYEYTFLANSEQDNSIRVDLSTLDVPSGVYEFVGKYQYAILTKDSYGVWFLTGVINQRSESSITDNQLILYVGSWYGPCYYRRFPLVF